MTRRPLLILADDLTGACDTAGAITAVAGPVTVRLDPRSSLGATSAVSAGIVVVDLDTRSAPAAAAVERTVDAVAAAPGEVYLKLDSTLRGHVVDTVAAAAGAFRAIHPGGRVVVCPAFPARGRVVRDRRVVVDGAALPSAALDDLAGVPGVEVADAATDSELAALAASTGAVPTLWAGSAGLAPHVAARGVSSVLEPDPARRGARSVPRTGGGLVAVVVGSSQAASVAGAAALSAGGDRRVRVLVGDPRRGTFTNEALAAVAGARAIVVTGGYTARRLLDGLGITELDVAGEIEPGIPWATAGALTVVTKAGGFGDAGTIGRLVDRLLGP